MTRDEWDKICKQCGKCCYEKVDLGGGLVHYTDEPCKYLDITTNKCTIFYDRHAIEPECISLTEELIPFLFWLPEDCAYVEYVRHKETIDAIREAEKHCKKKRISKRRK
jgi:uncharacterized protein